MPVIVVGADTEAGLAILDGLGRSDREIRAFVSDPEVGAELKERGFKVAIGDVSDETHVEAASTRCFSAVLIASAAADGREHAFAESPDGVLTAWARAVSNSEVSRAIWVTKQEPPPTRTRETVTVDPDVADLVGRVVALDDAQRI